MDEPGGQRALHPLGARQLRCNAALRWCGPLLQLSGRRRARRSVSRGVRPQLPKAPGTEGQIRPRQLFSREPEHSPAIVNPSLAARRRGLLYSKEPELVGEPDRPYNGRANALRTDASAPRSIASAMS